MVNVVEVAHEGFAAGAEHALGLEARGILSRLPVATAGAGASVAPGFNDHRLHRRDLDHLACAQQPACGLRQVGAAAVARGGTTLDDDVRGSPLAAAALMAGLGPALLLRPAVRTIGLAGPGGGVEEFEASLGGWVRRLTKSSNWATRASNCSMRACW